MTMQENDTSGVFYGRPCARDRYGRARVLMLLVCALAPLVTNWLLVVGLNVSAVRGGAR